MNIQGEIRCFSHLVSFNVAAALGWIATGVDVQRCQRPSGCRSENDWDEE